MCILCAFFVLCVFDVVAMEIMLLFVGYQWTDDCTGSEAAVDNSKNCSTNQLQIRWRTMGS